MRLATLYVGEGICHLDTSDGNLSPGRGYRLALPFP